MRLRRLSFMFMAGALFIMFWRLPEASVNAQEKSIKKGSLQWYLSGPRKEWSQGDYDDYYRWREKTYDKQLSKALAAAQQLRRQRTIINGNKITTEIWNYGSISSPGNRVTDIVWEGLGYGYEFAPFICAEAPVPPRSHRDAYIKRDANGNPVIGASGDTVWVARVISDGLISNGGEVSPDGKEFWGWEPLATNDDGSVPYADPNSTRIPTTNDIDRDGDGKPDSWPAGWYNANLKKYVWPGALKQGSTNADLEAFFVMDDRNNREFKYYPFINDSTRRGLGLEIECRYYQWSNPLAEDLIFLIYRVTNKSDKDLNEAIFGMWGDPHIGGPDNWPDDLAFFERSLNMVYAWDEDGRSDVAGRPPGYFGYKFLESPGNPDDGIDNDGDGLVDESQGNGIDEDNDWNPDKDDVGLDGVANTGDAGENDGVPTAGDPFDIRKPGEPNFEYTDLDESDMIGLTSFAGPPFGGSNVISNDNFIFSNFLIPGKFDSANSTQSGDNIFLYGSGPIVLKKGESRRFSIALLIGKDFDDLLLNAATAQQIYEINYQFAKPPDKPIVTAVPGDKRVTLYWDAGAEGAFDPISQRNDFEGYVIYRSTDPQFLDQQTITDANGSGFYFEPLKMLSGAAARFDLVNEYLGLSKSIDPARGVAYNLGNNTGLRHAFVDSNNVINGQTYYYAVVAYDNGEDSQRIAPAECAKIISVDPETNEILFDVNTVQVVPRAPAAGYVAAHLEDNGETSRIAHASGIATGSLRADVVDPRVVEENNLFTVQFIESPTRYTVEDMKPVAQDFVARVNEFVQLRNRQINAGVFALTTTDGGRTFVRDVDYELLPENGLLRAIPGGGLQNGQTYRATYRYFPMLNSALLADEEANPIFDGMKLFVKDEPLQLNTAATRFTSSSATNFVGAVRPFNNLDRNKFPADYEVRFSNSLIDSSSRPGFGYIKCNFQVFEVTRGVLPTRQRVIILENTATRDSLWSPGERVIILKGDAGVEGTWEFTFNPPASGNPIAPKAGDVYFIATTRPFTAQDSYSFTSRASTIDQAQAANELDRIAVVPNPYVVTNAIEQLDRQNPRDRGARRLYFNHLPRECTIRIFTITGELVETIEHSAEIDDGKVFWDLTTQDNFPIAYGVYIFHVDAGALGEKIGRFAVIK